MEKTSEIILKRKEIWMPHPAHFICGRDCLFHLATYINGIIVSTLGEYWPDSKVRKITAECRGIEIVGKGDSWDADYMEKIGFDTIGCDRKYETMTFKAIKTNQKCCPYGIVVREEIDGGYGSYNKAEDAFNGHYEILEKFSKIKGD